MNTQISFFILIGVCLILSFLFSGMEAGVFALSRLRIRQQVRSGRRSAILLHGYLEKPEDFLWTILVGNSLAALSALSMIVVGLHKTLGGDPVAFVLAFCAIAFVFHGLFDLLPKTLFRLFPTRLCLLVVVPFRFLHAILSPIVSLMTLISNGLLWLTGGTRFKGHIFGDRSELRMVMQQSDYNLSSEEKAMINRVLDLQNVTLRSVTVPFSKVAGVMVETPAREMLKLCRETGFTRVPVWQAGKEGRRVIGIASVRSMLFMTDLDCEKPAGAFVQPALYLREDLRLEEALRRMQRAGQRLAIVVAIDRREIGIVSLQDILRSIFGEVSL
ncbi:MAG: CNNM domain-containing protein [Verrucomicrobia bacterium]|nr:CNNM domain-containing protein [Verrucomicrobiota bacterium]